VEVEEGETTQAFLFLVRAAGHGLAQGKGSGFQGSLPFFSIWGIRNDFSLGPIAFAISGSHLPACIYLPFQGHNFSHQASTLF
jgi:hypothetical protein